MIIGGVNISSVYASNVFKSDEAKETRRDLWRDTDVQLEGPAVADLQRLFLETWQRQRGAPLKQAGFFPERKASGNQAVGIIGSTPTKAVPIYYISLLSAIRNAESRVWLTAAYFVPTRQEVEDMIAAAHRGVDVRLMLPGHSDSAICRPSCSTSSKVKYSMLIVFLVFDLIGGDIGKRSARLVRAGGTLVSIVGPSETRPTDGLAIARWIGRPRAAPRSTSRGKSSTG